MYRKNNVLSILVTQSIHHNPIQGLVVQLLSRVQLFVTLWTAARQDSLSYTVSWSLFSFTSVDEFGPLMSW